MSKSTSKEGVSLDATDLGRILVALRLRAEAADENGEKKQATEWRRTLAKVEAEFKSPLGGPSVRCDRFARPHTMDVGHSCLNPRRKA